MRAPKTGTTIGRRVSRGRRTAVTRPPAGAPRRRGLLRDTPLLPHVLLPLLRGVTSVLSICWVKVRTCKDLVPRKSILVPVSPCREEGEFQSQEGSVRREGVIEWGVGALVLHHFGTSTFSSRFGKSRRIYTRGNRFKVHGRVLDENPFLYFN